MQRFIQSDYQTPPNVAPNFELVVLEDGGKLNHYWRNNSSTPTTWVGSTATITSNATGAGSLIESDDLNFQVVVLEGNNLNHYWRDNGNPKRPWIGPTATISSKATGPGAIIQSKGPQGTPINFEGLAPLSRFPHWVQVVVPEVGDPSRGNNLNQYSRDKDTLKWTGPTATITQYAQGPGSLILSYLGGSKSNFEVIVPETKYAGGQPPWNFSHYWLDTSVPGNPWNGPTTPTITGNATGPGSLIQSRFGTPGNFEVVVLEGNNLNHYYRSNQKQGAPWTGPIATICSDAVNTWPPT
ncbi:hypothetical protein CNMCM5623_004596 [Aspergillus felis]|uniref:Uncharacterized protein n=1 Tax=Aspergillus felis TaxID=1287682 RepID=A0A8H6V1Y8_9EURO|nr:hypothetical protein CNMCM5623_004596 [Aspergillus felis]